MEDIVLKKEIMHFKGLNLVYIPMFKRIYLFKDGERLGEFKKSEYDKAKKTFYHYKKEMKKNGK